MTISRSLVCFPLSLIDPHTNEGQRTASAFDTNLVSASGKYLSVNWQASGGGAFLVTPLNQTGKVSSSIASCEMRCGSYRSIPIRFVRSSPTSSLSAELTLHQYSIPTGLLSMILSSLPSEKTVNWPSPKSTTLSFKTHGQEIAKICLISNLSGRRVLTDAKLVTFDSTLRLQMFSQLHQPMSRSGISSRKRRSALAKLTPTWFSRSTGTGVERFMQQPAKTRNFDFSILERELRQSRLPIPTLESRDLV